MSIRGEVADAGATYGVELHSQGASCSHPWDWDLGFQGQSQASGSLELHGTAPDRYKVEVVPGYFSGDHATRHTYGEHVWQPGERLPQPVLDAIEAVRSVKQ